MHLHSIEDIKLEALNSMGWYEPKSADQITESIIQKSRERFFEIESFLKELNKEAEYPVLTFVLFKTAETLICLQIKTSIKSALHQLIEEGDAKTTSLEQYCRATNGPPPSQPNTSRLPQPI